MDDNLIYIPNDDTQNYSFCKLKLRVETFGHSLNKPKNQANPTKKRKHYYKTLRTSVINSPMSPPSLIKWA